MKKVNLFLLFMLVVVMSTIVAFAADGVIPDKKDLTADQQQIVEKGNALAGTGWAIYYVIAQITSIVAAIACLIAGWFYFGSSVSPELKEAAKKAMIGIVIGIAVIWATPSIVGLLA
ncbi:MAG: hypothetical protein WC781_05575 [Candidatus Pacearchaeota archaeon]|jgi:hypothetical protein